MHKNFCNSNKIIAIKLNFQNLWDVSNLVKLENVITQRKKFHYVTDTLKMNTFHRRMWHKVLSIKLSCAVNDLLSVYRYQREQGPSKESATPGT